jgi:hypothetical protein
MTHRTTVVAGTQRLNKQQLHAKLMRGWARGIDRHGKGTFADKLECTTTGLDKQLAGSFPSFETLDRALDAEPTVLDDFMLAKGKRIVDANAVCDVDDASLLITRLLLWLQEAQHPDSPGGRAVVHTELLPAEFMIRQLHAATGNWIAKITHHREGSEEAA